MCGLARRQCLWVEDEGQRVSDTHGRFSTTMVLFWRMVAVAVRWAMKSLHGISSWVKLVHRFQINAF